MKNNFFKDNVMPVLVLASICLVVSAALGFTNSITAPIIDANKNAAAVAARTQLIPEAKSFTEIETDIPNVISIHEGSDGTGYIIVASSKGYGGNVVATCAVDVSGKLIGLLVDTSTETVGIGSRASEPEYIEQYLNAASPADVDLISGVTLTTRALKTAVLSAVSYLSDVDITVEEEAPKPETPAVLTETEIKELLVPEATSHLDMEPNNQNINSIREYRNDTDVWYVVETSARGYGGDIVVTTAFEQGETPTITGLYIDSSTETIGIGTRVSEPEFLEQFVGQQNLTEVDVDVLAGATISSNAVKKAVEFAFSAFYETSTTEPQPEEPQPEEPQPEEQQPEQPEQPETQEPDNSPEQLIPQATEFSEISVESDTIVSILKANDDLGYVITTKSRGYGGDIVATCAVDMSGKLIGLHVDSSTETVGIGSKVSNPEYIEQYLNAQNPADVDAVAGATISSRALQKAISEAVSLVTDNSEKLEGEGTVQ